MSLKINRRAQIALPVLVLSAGVALAACGGTSKSSSSGANAAATSAAGAKPTRPTGPTGAFNSRFAAVRECLQKNGVTLPPRTPGTRPPYGGFLRGATGPQLPSGVSREKFEAAVKKCGGPARFGAAGRLRSPAFRLLLTKFAACMRENGIDVPAPNTSGDGPVFNTTGINTKSPQFTAAVAKCRSDLRLFRPGRSGALGSG
jgi:hypothetical protein